MEIGATEDATVIAVMPLAVMDTMDADTAMGFMAEAGDIHGMASA
jgi:hypothetical protein